jgi:hypothetical protein
VKIQIFCWIIDQKFIGVVSTETIRYDFLKNVSEKKFSSSMAMGLKSFKIVLFFKKKN